MSPETLRPNELEQAACAYCGAEGLCGFTDLEAGPVCHSCTTPALWADRQLSTVLKWDRPPKHLVLVNP